MHWMSAAPPACENKARQKLAYDIRLLTLHPMSESSSSYPVISNVVCTLLLHLNVHHCVCIKITRRAEIHQDSACTWICWFNSQSCIKLHLLAPQMSILIICLKISAVFMPYSEVSMPLRDRVVFSKRCHPIKTENIQERKNKNICSDSFPHILYDLWLTYLVGAEPGPAVLMRTVGHLFWKKTWNVDG